MDGDDLDEQSPTAQEVADAKATENDLDLGDPAACSGWSKDANKIGGEGCHADCKQDVEKVVQRPAERVNVMHILLQNFAA